MDEAGGLAAAFDVGAHTEAEKTSGHPFDYFTPELEMFPHQADAFLRSCTKRVFAYLMEPGTGKTKLTLDVAAFLSVRHIINAIFIAAPNDVHAQWVEEQIPLHWPRDPRVPRLRPLVWEARSERIVNAAREMARGRIHLDGALPVLAMNHEAFATKKGRAIALSFVKHYKVLFALDEAHGFQTPKAQRTRAIQHLSDYCAVKRILTGTIIGQKPFTVYAPFKFLDWRILGFDSFLTFKHRYGEFETDYCIRVNKRTGVQETQTYEVLQSYKNLPELRARMAKYSYRIRKDECTNLPPKLPAQLWTHMSEAQVALYEKLKEEGMLLLKKAEAGEPVRPMSVAGFSEEELAERLLERGGRVSLAIKLVLMLRLQQIAGGFVTDDNKATRCIEAIPHDIPRIAATVEYVKNVVAEGGKVLVWAVFRPEIAALRQVLDIHLPGASAHISSGMTPSLRKTAIMNFKEPNSPVRVLIAHPRSLGVGQNFQVARTCVYYSHTPSNITRTQSEDRAHRIGQTGTVTMCNVIARNAPIDSTLIGIAQGARAIAEEVLSWEPKHFATKI
jgi:hypothetical protein